MGAEARLVEVLAEIEDKINGFARIIENVDPASYGWIVRRQKARIKEMKDRCKARKKETKWVQYVDDRTGCAYYCNQATGETTWDKPENYATEESALLTHCVEPSETSEDGKSPRTDIGSVDDVEAFKIGKKRMKLDSSLLADVDDENDDKEIPQVSNPGNESGLMNFTSSSYENKEVGESANVEKENPPNSEEKNEESKETKNNEGKESTSEKVEEVDLRFYAGTSNQTIFQLDAATSADQVKLVKPVTLSSPKDDETDENPLKVEEGDEKLKEEKLTEQKISNLENFEDINLGLAGSDGSKSKLQQVEDVNSSTEKLDPVTLLPLKDVETKESELRIEEKIVENVESLTSPPLKDDEAKNPLSKTEEKDEKVSEMLPLKDDEEKKLQEKTGGKGAEKVEPATSLPLKDNEEKEIWRETKENDPRFRKNINEADSGESDTPQNSAKLDEQEKKEEKIKIRTTSTDEKIRQKLDEKKAAVPMKLPFHNGTKCRLDDEVVSIVESRIFEGKIRYLVEGKDGFRIDKVHEKDLEPLDCEALIPFGASCFIANPDLGSEFVEGVLVACEEIEQKDGKRTWVYGVQCGDPAKVFMRPKNSVFKSIEEARSKNFLTKR